MIPAERSRNSTTVIIANTATKNNSIFLGPSFISIPVYNHSGGGAFCGIGRLLCNILAAPRAGAL